jgi:DNA helicase IV
MARAVTPYVEVVWPQLKADEVLAEFLSDPRPAAQDILTADEQRAIAWPQPRKAKSARWTAADAVLLDEVSALLERSPTYGHVIVDEAQDLSPMQCRAIARRSEHSSITVLGDLAQGTTAWAATDWTTQLAHLGKPSAEVVALSTGYRVPATVIELANHLLAALDVTVPPTTSYRSDGELTITRVDDLASATVETVQRALAVEGSVGVIAADHQLPAVCDALKAAGIEVSAADDDGRVTVVPASLAKGLEYDHVIALEPAEIVASEPRGLNRLYVVLTRAVSRLDILHSRELPPELER